MRRVGSVQLTNLASYAATWLHTPPPSEFSNKDQSGRPADVSCSHTAHTRSLLRTGAQTMALIVSTRPDFIKNAPSAVAHTEVPVVSTTKTPSFNAATLASLSALQIVSLLNYDPAYSIQWGSDADEKGGQASSYKAVRSLIKGSQHLHLMEETSNDGGGTESWACIYHLLALLDLVYIFPASQMQLLRP